MYSSTYLKWFRRLLILGAVVAGLTASAAGARLDPGTPPDVSDVAFGLSATPATDVSRPPDVRDAAGSVSTATPDVFERYASAHPYGVGLTSSEVSTPPDVQDAASALHMTAEGVKADGLRWQGIADSYMQLQSGQTELVSSPPDVQDAASALHSTPEGLKADGLRWQGVAQAYQQIGTSDPVTRILAQERGRRLDQGLFATSTPSVQVVESGGFDWDDYAIGIGSGIGIALLLGAGLMFGRQQRHRMQPV